LGANSSHYLHPSGDRTASESHHRHDGTNIRKRRCRNEKEVCIATVNDCAESGTTSQTSRQVKGQEQVR
jgi:hypothetical protein